MVVPCELQRLDGAHTIDPETGERTDNWATYWAGGGNPPDDPGCKLQTSREAREMNVGGQRVTAKPTNVGIPWGSPRPQVGDKLATDRGTFFVTGVDHHSSPIMLRFTAAENQG